VGGAKGGAVGRGAAMGGAETKQFLEFSTGEIGKLGESIHGRALIGGSEGEDPAKVPAEDSEATGEGLMGVVGLVVVRHEGFEESYMIQR